MSKTLHIKFEVLPWKAPLSVSIEPDKGESQYENLLLHLQYFNITNPAKDFAVNYKSGIYDSIPQQDVGDIADAINMIAPCWDIDGSPKLEINALFLIQKLIEMLMSKSQSQKIVISHPLTCMLECDDTSCYFRPIHQSDKAKFDYLDNFCINRPIDSRLAKVSDLLWGDGEDSQDFCDIFMKCLKELQLRL